MSSSSPSLASLSRDPDRNAVVASKTWCERAAVLLPWVLLSGFAALLLLVIGDRLLPAREVALARVIAIGGVGEDVAALTGTSTPLFQASGWIEPDPLPVKATALVDGIVREVHVLEGETVKKGQLLATLIDDDARLNLRTAESRLDSLRALTDAQKEQPAIIRSEIATLSKMVEAAGARRAELEDQVKRYDAIATSGSGAVSEREVSLARLQLATQQADIAALGAREEELLGKLRLQEATTRDFEARLAEAETEVDRRQLELDRTRILSPIDGIVLRLVAVPGQKRMLGMDDPESSTIAVLYEPDHLQARIDVPLAEAAKLEPGQRVRLRAALFPDRVFHGTVTRIAGEADLQRNTLQAKVRIEDPDPRLRPEMLCRSEFLPPPVATETPGGAPPPVSGGIRLYVPERALTEVGESRAMVWKVDVTGARLEAVEIVLGEDRREDHLLVREGLRPGDRVVIDPPADLESGERIREKNPNKPIMP